MRNVPLATLTVIGLPDGAVTVPAAIGGVDSLLTLLNSKVAPELVPTVSVAGVICGPVSLIPRVVLLPTVMLPEPCEPWISSLPALMVVNPL